MIPLSARNASDWTGPTGNTTYLFRGSPSVLIDAGVGHPEHVEEIAHALGGGDLNVVLITHSHVDHQAGVPALASRWPQTVVRGGPGDPLGDGELIRAGETQLRALHTPGHAPDHFCFEDVRSREVFCGDLVRIGGTVVIPASKGGNLRQYLASLRRIRELQPPRLLPAHGPVIDDPVAVIDEYLEHRASRERQIAQARDSGARTVAEIVARVYPDLSPALRAAAEETVRAHLQKMSEEGYPPAT